MRLEMIVDSPAVFAEWLSGIDSPAPAAVSPAVVAGHDLFASKGCVACHTISGRDDAVGIIGPNLSLFGERLTLGSATLGNTTENLTAWLKDPEEIKPALERAKASNLPAVVDVILDNSIEELDPSPLTRK